MKPSAALLALLLLPAACAGVSRGEVGSALGAGFGGFFGGVAGSQIGSGFGRTAATIAGASLGALFGSKIGARLAEGDLAHMQRATQETLETAPSGQATEWRNPDTGRSGAVVAGSAYRQDEGPCRPFEQSVVIDGRTERAEGVACRQPDGTWKVVPDSSDRA